MTGGINRCEESFLPVLETDTFNIVQKNKRESHLFANQGSIGATQNRPPTRILLDQGPCPRPCPDMGTCVSRGVEGHGGQHPGGVPLPHRFNYGVQVLPEEHIRRIRNAVAPYAIGGGGLRVLQAGPQGREVLGANQSAKATTIYPPPYMDGIRLIFVLGNEDCRKKNESHRPNIGPFFLGQN